MDLSVIKSYLVSLGFAVDQPQLKKFNDALRNISVEVERVTTGTPFGMASMFVKAGAAVTGVLATIAAGTVGLMDHVASADLDFQLLARRMYMSTDAAKSMKIATDALGYSLEEIVRGPKELQDRFGILTRDQATMQAGLGPDFEKQMQAIREVRFQFTRLDVELQYLAMGVVKDLSIALFGDESSLQQKLQHFNDYLRDHLPEISQEIATKLVPVIKDMGKVLQDVWIIIKQIDIVKLADDMVRLSDALTKFFDFLGTHPLAQKMILGAMGGAAAGKFIPGVGFVGGAIGGAAMGAMDQFGNSIGAFDPNEQKKAENWNKYMGWLYRVKVPSQEAIKNLIVSTAIKMGLDPSIALGIADKETGFNQAARGKAGEIGVFQLMPNTARMLGVDPNDLSQNVQGGIAYIMQMYAKYHDWAKAIAAYNGTGPAARSYADDVINNRIPRYTMPGTPGVHGGVGTTIGNLNIHITQPHASKEEIQAAVKQGVSDGLKRQEQMALTNGSGVYA